ncbi:cytochrome P450 [Rhodococcus sp. WS4]|nr:cytochrome P450 [Rhodococcus sp. WS4]
MNTTGSITHAPYADELHWPEGLVPLRNEDDGTLAEPYEQYAWLRENAPVVRLRTGGEDVWIVTRYDDVRAAARMHKVFSSQMSDVEQPTFITLFDGADHTRLRRVYAEAFNPKSVALVADRVRERAEHLIDELIDDGRGDVVDRVCVPLTMATIGGILDVPTTDVSKLKFWSNELLVWHSRFRGLPSTDESAGHTQDFFAYLQERLEQLHADKSESVGGHLARNWKEGNITAKEAREMGAFLFMAGHDTTTFLIGNGFRELVDNPSLLDRIRRNPADAERFVEELARKRGPVHRIHRRTMEDVDLGGVTIPKRGLVRLVIASANRDSAKFADPDKFDLDRDYTGHLGFGFGVHSCIGVPLARLEARILVEVLAQKVGTLKIGPGPSLVLTPGHAITLGPTELDVELTAAR